MSVFNEKENTVVILSYLLSARIKNCHSKDDCVNPGFLMGALFYKR